MNSSSGVPVSTDSREPGWRRVARRIGIDLRPGEGHAVLLLFVCLFLLLTFQISTKTVRQSTFIDALGSARLPLVYLLVALTSYPFLRIYNRYTERYRVEQLLTASCGAVAIALVGFWALMRFPWPWITVLFYLFSSIVYGLLTSQFWLFANHLFDPRQAKRLFGFIGAGALLGGILGGQIARLASKALGTGSVLIVSAVLLLLVTAVLWRSRKVVVPAEADEGAHRKRDGGDKLERAKGGFTILRHSRLLQTIAAVTVLTIVVGQIVDLQFNWAVEQTTTTLDQRTAFYGNFFSAMGVAAFIFQLLFTSRIHRRLGIGFAMRVLPVTMGVGTIAMFLAAGFAPELLIAAALILKVGESGLRYSLDQATRELLFLPVPVSVRARAKAFIDVFVQRGAKGLSALMLFPVTFGLISVVQAGWMSLVLVAIWMAVIVVTSREYVQAFRDGLRQRSVDTAIPVDLSDVTTLELLLESLGSSDRRQVLHSLEILEANDRLDLVPPLLLYHDDPQVRFRTLTILAEAERIDVAPLIERRLGDGDPDVRAEALRVLAAMKGEDVCDLMVPKLEEGDAGIRAAAVACLANYGNEEMLVRAKLVLADLLSDEDPKTRVEAAKAIGAIAEPLFQENLIRLLYDPAQRVVSEAISAIRRRVGRDGFNPLYVPTLVSLLRNRRAKHEAREALVAFGEPVIPALVHFMNDDDEPIWVRRALPKAIASIGTMAAAKALMEGLEQGSDAFHRRKLIEALSSMRGRDARHITSRQAVVVQLREEACRYLSNLAALQALGVSKKGQLLGVLIAWDGEEVPTLLDQLLEEQISDHLRNLFGLLGLLYGADQVWPAYRSLVSESKLERAKALEFLDNTLEGEIKRIVFGVIDDCPLHEKLSRAARDFAVEIAGRTGTLKKFLNSGATEDSDAVALAAAALYHVHQERVGGLEESVRRLVNGAQDPFVQETAQWVAGRMGL